MEATMEPAVIKTPMRSGCEVCNGAGIAIDGTGPCPAGCDNGFVPLQDPSTDHLGAVGRSLVRIREVQDLRSQVQRQEDTLDHLEEILQQADSLLPSDVKGRDGLLARALLLLRDR